MFFEGQTGEVLGERVLIKGKVLQTEERNEGWGFFRIFGCIYFHGGSLWEGAMW